MKQSVNTIFREQSTQALAKQLGDEFRRTNGQLNSLTEGRLAALHTAVASPPAVGEYAVGDFLPNSARGVVLGTAGSQYLLMGWVCTMPNPLTWAESRTLTGT